MSTCHLIGRALAAQLLVSALAALAAAADRSADANAPSPEQHSVTITVRAWLRVRAVPPRIGADGKLDLAEFEFYKRNLAAIVKSPLVVNKALDDKSIKELPLIKEHAHDADGLAEWLIDQLRVRYPGDAEIMTVEIRATDRQQASTILNAVVAGLMSDFVDGRERTDRLTRVDTLEKKFIAKKQQVIDKERQLYNLSQQIGFGDAQTAKVKYKMEVDALDTLMRSRTDIQRRLTDLDLKLSLAKVTKAIAEKETVPEEEIEAAISKDPQIQKMSLELAKLIREKKSTDPLTGKPDAIQGQIDKLKKSIDEAKSAARRQIIDQIGGSSAALKGGLVERQLLEAQYKQITEQIGVQAQNVQELERFNGEADELRGDIDQLKAVVRDMGTTLAKQKIESDAEPRVSVIELPH
jgi:hypothetical protein